MRFQLGERVAGAVIGEVAPRNLYRTGTPHGVFLTGRDSSLVRFRSWAARTFRHVASAAFLCCVASTRDVLAGNIGGARLGLAGDHLTALPVDGVLDDFVEQRGDVVGIESGLARLRRRALSAGVLV